MSGRWALPPLSVGEFAPPLLLPTRANPRFHLNSLTGRYVLLAFMPREPARRDAALTAFQVVRPRFDDRHLTACLVAGEPVSADSPDDSVPGLRWLFDADGEVRRRFHLPDDGGWLLFDPTLRLLDQAPLAAPEPLFARIAALPPPAGHAGTPLVAPVLIVPRVLEPELCGRLIAYHEACRGQLPGGAMDEMKRRSGVLVEDQALRSQLVDRLRDNLAPMVARALQFRATRIERCVVGCYDAENGGDFRRHEDNETRGAAHRRFACSINLNAEAFRGGDLYFPGFGPQTYRPPTGGAVVYCCNLQHETTPVTAGRRYAFLPFLSDEEGQAIRQQSRAAHGGPVDAPAEH